MSRVVNRSIGQGDLYCFRKTIEGWPSDGAAFMDDFTKRQFARVGLALLFVYDAHLRRIAELEEGP